jgi:nitrite reductase/ring-hydroxylating ferredoxin subunit
LTRIRLCSLAELEDGRSRGFDPGDTGRDWLFVVRRGDGAVVYLDECPHEGSRMPWRRHEYLNAARDRIVCNAHGAQFEIDTGLCVLGPCLGRHLPTIAHSIDLAGDISIEVDAAHIDGGPMPRKRKATRDE